MNSINALPCYFKTWSNIIFPPTPRSSYWCILPSDFPDKILYAFLMSPIRVTCPVHLIIIDLITLKIFCGVYKLRNSSFCSLLQPPAYKMWLILWKSYKGCKSPVTDQISAEVIHAGGKPSRSEVHKFGHSV